MFSGFLVDMSLADRKQKSPAMAKNLSSWLNVDRRQPESPGHDHIARHLPKHVQKQRSDQPKGWLFAPWEQQTRRISVTSHSLSGK